MKVKELNRDQLTELKGKYLDSKIYEEEKRGASYGELAQADELVSDSEIFEEYAGIDFVNDDFACTTGKQSIEELEEEAKADIDYALSELERITHATPLNDDILELHQLCNGLEQVASDLREAVNRLENAQHEGVA